MCSSLSHISLCVFKPQYCTCLIYAFLPITMLFYSICVYISLPPLILYSSSSSHTVCCYQTYAVCLLPFVLKPFWFEHASIFQLSAYISQVFFFFCILLYLQTVMLCCLSVKKLKRIFYFCSPSLGLVMKQALWKHWCDDKLSLICLYLIGSIK